VNHLVSPHHDLDHVSAFWTTHHDAPAESKISDLFVIECEVIDAMGAVEQRNTFGFGRRDSECAEIVQDGIPQPPVERAQGWLEGSTRK